MKKQKHSHLFSVLVIVDDFADDPSFFQDTPNYYIRFLQEADTTAFQP
jgi:hypothetical protein